MGVTVASIFWILLDVAGAYTRSSTGYGVEKFESRFGDLRNGLTPQMTFGYVSDNRPDDPSDQAEFYLTQYTLVPALVTTSAAPAGVIANMHAATPDMNALRARNLVCFRNFGNGIFLCRNMSVR